MKAVFKTEDITVLTVDEDTSLQEVEEALEDINENYNVVSVQMDFKKGSTLESWTQALLDGEYHKVIKTQTTVLCRK